MPKNRFSKLDIRRVSQELHARLSGYFVSNVYDVDNKTFLLKLTKRGGGKELVLIESGVRFHSTKFVKDKSEMPSGFSMKLRKHIREKRLLAVRQLGEDRVVDFTFGFFDRPETHFHILLELYAAGNVVLTDHEYKVLSLIRVFKDDEVRFAVGENYMEAIKRGVQVAEESAEGGEGQAPAPTNVAVKVDALREHLLESLPAAAGTEPEEAEAPAEAPAGAAKGSGGGKGGKGGKGSKKSASVSLKQALTTRASPVNLVGPDVIEHCILLAGLKPGAKLTREMAEDAEALGRLAATLAEESSKLEARLDDLETKSGVLIYEPSKAGEDAEGSPVFYDRFEPFLLEQHKASQYKEFDSLDEAVDEYFSKIDMQRQEKKAISQRRQAAKKVEAIKSDQEKRIEQLHVEVVRKKKGAEAMTHSLENVDRALLIVRSAVANGMSWEDLQELIEQEKAKGNPIADLIHSTQLETNQITLELPMPEGDADDKEEAAALKAISRGGKPGHIRVHVDINLSAFANITELYSNKKQAVSKAERTLEASSKVLEDAQKKFRKEVERQEQKRKRVRVQRKINWFEKFRWFITSEGFLVLSGRDAQQNELLVKKFLRKDFGDIYVHADLHGAASCIIRSPRPGVEIPPESLRQAGAATVCMSSAWAAKIITSAWWVRADQVSKTAPSGEYLSTGSFMIRGKKNFLPPCRLELTFSLLFKLDETQESFDGRRVEWRAQEEVAAGVASKPASPAKARPAQADTDDASVEDNEEGEGDSDGDGDGDGEGEGDAQEANEDREDEDGNVNDDTDDNDDEDNDDDDDDCDKEADKEADKLSEPDDLLERPVPSKSKAQQQTKQTKQQQTKKAKSGNGKAPRGKRGKMKKMKKKYADQTEEDRRLAMLALGHQVDGESTEEEAEAEAAATSRPERSQGRQKAKAARPPRPPTEEEKANDELNLRSFTCNPQPDDVVLYAMPFCSPPQATTSYKYRCKVVPGGLKKGKASKQAQELFLRVPTATDHEKELVRAIPEPELIQSMQGGVKISIPGATNAKKGKAPTGKRKKKPRK